MRLRNIICWLGRHYTPHGPALSMMRIAVALVVITDLIIRLGDLEAHYCDSGLWPVEFVSRFGWKEGYWSLHALSGAKAWQLALFVLHLAAATMLLLGWHTTPAAFLTWYLLVSLHNRNVYILQGGDDLLRITLFLGIFLPWHTHFSLDRRQGRGSFFPPTVFFYIAYLLLIASVYLFTVMLKTSSEWRSEGTAVYYALSLEQIRLPYSGDLVYRFPGLMKALTWLVLLLESLIPFLVLWPSRSGRSRTAAFLCIALLHAGIASTLYVGLFPLIAVATAIGLLPLRARGPAPVPHGRPFADRWLRAALATFAIAVSALCLLLNLQGLPNFDYEVRASLRKPLHMFRLDQYWGMFSPSVIKKDGWFVYHGVDSAGRQWDLRLDRPSVDYSKPRHIVSMYGNDRWRKLAENMENDNFTFLRPLYARYVLRKWNADHPEKPMLMLSLYHMEKTNQPDYRPAEIKKVLYCVTDGR